MPFDPLFCYFCNSIITKVDYNTLVATILATSITGAGLILAIYGIISPIATEFLKNRVDAIQEKVKAFTTTAQEMEEPDKDADYYVSLNTNIAEIQGMRSLPNYLNWMIIPFIGYIISALFSLWWLLDRSLGQYNRNNYFWITYWSFGLSTFIFGIIGFLVITDIKNFLVSKYRILQNEAKEQQKKLASGVMRRKRQPAIAKVNIK